MRLALACVVALCLAAPARADVFVPADPPDAAASDCAAAAGEVYASGHGAAIQARIGDGPPVEVPGSCPLVAAAADGTAAVAGSSLVVRRPGVSFGAPIALGVETQAVAIAVAPGGWAVAIMAENLELVALVVHPDGSVARTVVDREASFFDVHAGIDAAGTVTAVARRHDGRSSALRVARLAAGGAPSVAVLPDSEEASVATVAVAPGGSTLLSWTREDGVRVMLDGAAPLVVDATSGDVASLSASLAADGTALVAYLRQRDELVTVERLGGAWQRPRVQWSSAERRYDTGSDESERVLTTLTPSGRAAVAWSTVVDDEPRVFASLGQAGSWPPPERLSSLTRAAFPTSLAPDAAGVPRLLWTELDLGVRGATVAPARIDTTPPEVTARFPARLPRTRDGRVTLAVSVSCSEACDARFSVPSPEATDLFDIDEFGSVVRAVAAGRTTTLRFRLRSEIAHELVRNPRARRLRLRLLVTDRAGNLARRSDSVRVRVIEKPIRSLKVAAGHDFGMKSAAGNRMVATLVNETIETAAAHRVSESGLQRRFARGRAAIRRAGHTEIRSSRILRRIYDALDVPLTRAGYDTDLVLS